MRSNKRLFSHAPARTFTSIVALLAIGTAVTAPAASAAPLSPVAGSGDGCALVRPADVAGYAAQLRDARLQTQRSPRVGDFRDPGTVRELIRTTMPRFRPVGGSSHPITARELATYRAGELVATGGMSVAAAIGACGARPAAAGLGALPMFQSCAYPPCNVPHPVKTIYDSTGNYADLYLNQETGNYVSETSFSSKGSQTATGGIQVVSNTTWEPWVNGGQGGSATFPAVAQTTTTPSAAYVGNLPVPSSVPQSGWVVLPGANIWADLGTNSVLVPIDSSGNDYYTVSGVANSGMQVYVHAVTPQGTISENSPVSYPSNGKFLSPALGATAIEIAIYLMRIPGFNNINYAAVITGDTLTWSTVYDPTIITDTSWSYAGGDLGSGGGGGGGGGGCEAVLRGGAAIVGRHITPLDINCDGDDW